MVNRASYDNVMDLQLERSRQNHELRYIQRTDQVLGMVFDSADWSESPGGYISTCALFEMLRHLLQLEGSPFYRFLALPHENLYHACLKCSSLTLAHDTCLANFSIVHSTQLLLC